MPVTAATSFALGDRDDAAKREFWSALALRYCKGLGGRRTGLLLERFGGAHAAVLSVSSWVDAGLPALCAGAFRSEKWRQKAHLDWLAAKMAGCGVLLWTDAEYPAWLRSIPDPPPYLYFSGDLPLLNGVAAAVVGMRKCSREGLAATVQIARGLSEAGVTVVSGMAMGIDRAAHLAALDGPGGSIGVLGAGIDVEYPRSNGDLYALMRRKGLLLSEYPPGCNAEAKHFPVRNRIVSGLSRAVVVVEAALRSGSLNTASHALEQNRELMAVPGPASAASARGCQELVRRGAKPVFCADDVLQELVPYLAERVRQAVLDKDEGRFRYRGNVPSPQPLAAQPVPEIGMSSGQGLPWLAGEGKAKLEPAIPSAAPVENIRQRKTKPPREALEGMEAAIVDLVRMGPVHIDDICRALGHNAATVSRALAALEIRGHIARLPGMRYTTG